MAFFDSSGFVGVSLDDIFASESVRSQLSETTKVAVLETDGKTNASNWQELDGDAFKDRVQHWEGNKDVDLSRDTEKTILIFYEFSATPESPGTLFISPELFQSMCRTLRIPAIFVKAVFETPWKAHTCGQAYFVEYGPKASDMMESGAPATLATGVGDEITGVTIFYHFQFGLGFDRSYVFTRYDYKSNTSTNVCINCVPPAQTSWGTVVGPLRAEPALRSPFSFHVMLLQHILDGLDSDVVNLRRDLLRYERTRMPLADLAAATSELHHLAQCMHICAEYYADTEAKVEFLIQAYNSYRSSSWVKTPEATMRQDLDHLEAARWRTSVSKRWVVDYKNRVNIRINLVFHVSNQEQAAATAAIAQDAARESSSMGTVAAVTLLFLPPTFLCALFSMEVFFDASGDSLKLSRQWWLYPATAIPLTTVVMAMWVIWRRFRLQRKCLWLDLEAGVGGKVKTP